MIRKGNKNQEQKITLKNLNMVNGKMELIELMEEFIQSIFLKTMVP